MNHRPKKPPEGYRPPPPPPPAEGRPALLRSYEAATPYVRSLGAQWLLAYLAAAPEARRELLARMAEDACLTPSQREAAGRLAPEEEAPREA